MINMVNPIKKHTFMTLIICLLLIITVIVMPYLSKNKKREEDYIKIFQENKIIFDELSSSLMSLEHGTSIYKESGNIIVKNRNNTELSEYFRDEKTKSNIERAIRDLGIRSIGKINEYLEFTYYSKKDSYSIVYATNENQLRVYTEIQHLEGNWYYSFIFHE